LYFGERPQKPETSETSVVDEKPVASDLRHKNELIYKYDNSYLWLVNRKWKKLLLFYGVPAYYSVYLFMNETLMLLDLPQILAYLGAVAVSSLGYYAANRFDSMVLHGVLIQRNFKKTYFVVDPAIMESKSGYVPLPEILSEDSIQKFGFNSSAVAAEV